MLSKPFQRREGPGRGGGPAFQKGREIEQINICQALSSATQQLKLMKLRDNPDEILQRGSLCPGSFPGRQQVNEILPLTYLRFSWLFWCKRCKFASSKASASDLARSPCSVASICLGFCGLAL